MEETAREYLLKKAHERKQKQYINELKKLAYAGFLAGVLFTAFWFILYAGVKKEIQYRQEKERQYQEQAQKDWENRMELWAE